MKISLRTNLKVPSNCGEEIEVVQILTTNTKHEQIKNVTLIHNRYHEFANIVRKRMGKIVTVDHKTNIRFPYKYNCSVL